MQRLPKQLKKNSKSGYMLIEIMVSLSIFAIVAVSSAGALLAVIDANAKAQTIKSVMDNLSVAVENMSRTIRIGTDYKCIAAETAYDAMAQTGTNSAAACEPGTKGISFLPQDADPNVVGGDRVKYYIVQTTGQNGQVGTIRRFRNGVETDLTAPEVNITSMRFRILGTGGDGGQPRVMIIINGIAGNTAQTQSNFNIQTTIAERQLAN